MDKTIIFKNPNIRQFIADYFVGESPISNTLAAIFDYNSHGTEWASRYDNLLPLVQFAITQLAYRSLPLKGDEQELHHCISQIDAIIEHLEYLANNNDTAKNQLLHDAAYIKVLRTDLIERPNHIRIINFFQILVKNWANFKGLSITYRLLMDLTLMEKGWRNYDEDKEELLSIIKKVTDEWE